MVTAMLAFFCQIVLMCAAPSQDAEGLHGVELRNKPPHWNESLRCWCLNFRGRVKLASVKNFQLIASTDPSKTIVMQASLMLP